MAEKRIDGFSVWLLFGTSFTVIFVYLLVNQPLCGAATQFCSTDVFFTVLVGSLVMIILLAILNNAKGRGKTPAVILFFMRDWTLKKIAYIPIGIIGVFAVAFIGGTWGSNIGAQYGMPYLGSLIAIGLAGVVLMITLLRTHAIAVPIVIHGVYNAVVTYSQSAPSGSFISSFANLPLTVPHLGLTLGSVVLGPVNEILFQIFLVAVAEEVFKVFILDFIIVGLKGKYDVKNTLTWQVIFAAAVSVLVWVGYHTINAVPIN